MSEQRISRREGVCFGAETTGWVVLAPDGRPLACRPSHWYGEEDIRADLDAILRGK